MLNTHICFADKILCQFTKKIKKIGTYSDNRNTGNLLHAVMK